MASFDRPERCVLSRAHTPRFITLAMFPCRQTNVSLQSTAIAVGDCTPIVHADCKRSKAHSSVSRNLSSPIPGLLVVKSKYQTPVSAPDKRTRPYDSRTRLCDKFRKIRARNYIKKKQKKKNDFLSLISVLASLEKTIPMGRLHMRPFQWYLKQTGSIPSH